jgi:mannan endo-1,4-beta-mannosidase
LTQPSPESSASRRPKLTAWLRRHIALAACAAVVSSLAVVVLVVKSSGPAPDAPPMRYLGVYEPDAPGSYTGIDRFATAAGRQPNLVCYYSAWGEKFQARFAAEAAAHGAESLVQINPYHVSMGAIASGRYDRYLRSYAADVRAYGKPVMLSFGHEMNGYWFPWGYRNVRPGQFVAAWRHIVSLFRAVRTDNVTWLWTVNIIALNGRIPNPRPWWPGSSYVNVIGIDGYYFKPSWSFAPLFGPTIRAVRAITRDPIILAETGAGQAAGQAAKIADLFAGIRAYGLLGFVWFDSVAIQDWRLENSAALAAFRRAVKTYMRPVA